LIVLMNIEDIMNKLHQSTPAIINNRVVVRVAGNGCVKSVWVLAPAAAIVFLAFHGNANAGALDGGTVSGIGDDSAYGVGAQARSSIATSTSTAVGRNASAQADGSVAVGDTATVIIGGGTGSFSTVQPNGLAVGSSALANGANVVAVGSHATALHDFATALGYQASAAQLNAVALGGNSMAANVNSIALGFAANASTDNSVALGANSVTTAAVPTASVTIGANTYNFAGATPVGVVSVGAPGAERQLINVAAGQVSATSTDAINGSQLFATNQQVTQNTTEISSLSAALNSGSTGAVRQDSTTRNITIGSNTDGTVVDMTGTAGTRTVTGVTAGAVTADSTDAVNGSQLYDTNQRIENITATGSSFVASDVAHPAASATGTGAMAIGDGANASGANSVALGTGSVADQDNTVSVGSPGNERRITNVAPGINGTDAANMNQLNLVQNNVNTVARQSFSGVAAAMAMPSLTPSAPGKTVVAAGVGNYKGYSAVGVGGTYRSMNSHWLVNAAASFTPHGDTGVRAQVGYEF
jgi:trimeric autotransporter adhesin